MSARPALVCPAGNPQALAAAVAAGADAVYVGFKRPHQRPRLPRPQLR